MKHFYSMLIFLFCLNLPLFSQESKDHIDKEVERILSQMTLEEKIDYIGGYNNYDIREIPRLNLPLIRMSDGPVGARNDGKSTSYPSPVLLSSTWNTALANVFGKSIGDDCRARGVHVLLMPGVNIMRSPLCGRNFEYYSEDPFLCSRLAVATIKGLQEKGVSACVKHFALNNQEWDRSNVSSNVDERTLHEIYMPAFKAAVMEAKVGTVMDSYNLVNGKHSTENSHINIDILKKMWGFDGVVMSDWGATHDAIAAAKGGLDLEMQIGEPLYFNRANLLPAIKNGLISESLINDKVSRILRMILKFGFRDRPQLNKSIPLDNKVSSETALNVAREGIVLLKNENQVLPINRDKIKTIALLGPNANRFMWGGGSSSTVPFHSVTTYDGIKKLAGKDVAINLLDDDKSIDSSVEDAVYYVSDASNRSGLSAEYFDNQNLSGSPIYKRIDSKVNFDWKNGSPVDNVIPNDHFSVRWIGEIKVENPGEYTFMVKGDDGYRLWVDGNLIINEWHNQALTQSIKSIYLGEKKNYQVKLEYFENSGEASICMGYKDGSYIRKASQLASSSDMAIVCVGFNDQTEHEGADRSFDLPGSQNALINAVTKVNPNTIIIVNAGGNVNMQQWIKNVKALLYAWYPGQEGGTALAEILFGKINPSGRLPVTFEKKWEDNPTYPNYYLNTATNAVEYKEKLLVGYRYYDTKNVEPQYPFGYGLSYSSFVYNDLKVKKCGANSVNGSVKLKNVSKVDGYEVVQIYVRPINPSIERPVHELKYFKKVFVKAGNTAIVKFSLKQDAFSYYNVHTEKWVVDKCNYMIEIGKDSRTVVAKAFIPL